MEKEKKAKPEEWREARRLRAWELKEKGWKQEAIAEALGVTKGAVSQWISKARQGGVEALYGRQGGGPKPRLTQKQLAQLPDLLARGAVSHGFRGDVWTCKRVGVVVKREFGVSYSAVHIGRILAKIGWSLQKPIERASQRDEAAIEHWRSETWQNLKKKPNPKSEQSCL